MNRYRTTLDRIGWALATGVAACGAVAAFLGWSGGASWTGGLGIGLIGAMLGAVVIAGIGAPVWWQLKWRGPAAAGVTGAAVGAVVMVAAMTRGFGLALPAGDDATAAWTSALATGAVAAFLGALLALAMWLVAYRER